MSRFVNLALSVVLAAGAVSATPFPLTRPQTSNNIRAKKLSKLMSKAVPHGRRLDEDADEIDLSDYSVKFEKCQVVKQWSAEEDGGGEDVDDVLQTNRFIIFRLCPSKYGSSCSSNYGEYLVDLETYLESTVEYLQEQQEAMCEACQDACEQDEEEEDEDGRKKRELSQWARRHLEDIDCDSCVDECDKIENMENNGYLEATDYAVCQQLDIEADDDNAPEYWAAAMCASSGEKIKIGVFSDEECTQHQSSVYVDDYLNGFKLSHALLKSVYAGSNIACSYYDEDEGAYEENEMCMNLYEAAAKCESDHNFQNGYVYEDENGNQAKNEEVVCDFISSLKSGAYDATSGEIALKGKNSVYGGGQKATGGQKFALVVLILGTIGLAVFAASLHSQLTKGGKADLSKQGGQMA